jgi:sigma-B regulation protein RsbU (phosphoserine phosphatase)
VSRAEYALLVVDDNDDNRFTLTRRLKREGYENVAVAGNGEQALELLAHRSIDLLLLDVMMPGLNGYQVLERMRADDRLRHIPVIMISALDEIDSVIRCIELGAEDYLSKPFNPTLLRARVGASLEKKRLRDELMKHARRMQQELETAREIQLGMVPDGFCEPTAERPLEIFAALWPAREVGGDLYDFFWMTPERLCVVVADVSDKGAGAALFMARAKSVIRLLATLLAERNGPAVTAGELVQRANQELCRDNPHCLFVTLVLAVVDMATGEVEYCNAGHTAPYVVAPLGSVVALDSARGKPVGILDGVRYESAVVKLAPAESLFIFTDGITEAINEAGELLGEERLMASLRSGAHAGPRGLVSRVLEDVRTFAGAAAPSDDIAALACRWRA